MSAVELRRLQPFAFEHEGEVVTFYALDAAAARRMYAAWTKRRTS